MNIHGKYEALVNQSVEQEKEEEK